MAWNDTDQLDRETDTLDDLETVDTEPEAEEQPSNDAPSTKTDTGSGAKQKRGRRKAAAGSTAGLTRGNVIAVLEANKRLTVASDEARTVLGTLFRTDDTDLEALTIEVLTQQKSDGDPLTDLLKLRETVRVNPFLGIAQVMGMEKGLRGRVHALLVAVADAEELPRADDAAAAALGQAIVSLTDEHELTLQEAQELRES